MPYPINSQTYKVCRRLADSKSASPRAADQSYAVRRLRRLRRDFRNGKIASREYFNQCANLQFIIAVLAEAQRDIKELF